MVIVANDPNPRKRKITQKSSTRSYSLTSRSVHLPMLLPSGPVMAGGGVFGDLGPLLTLLKTVLSFCEWVVGLRGEAKKRRSEEEKRG